MIKTLLVIKTFGLFNNIENFMKYLSCFFIVTHYITFWVDILVYIITIINCKLFKP